jgi:hypothetical protein
VGRSCVTEIAVEAGLFEPCEAAEFLLAGAGWLLLSVVSVAWWYTCHALDCPACCSPARVKRVLTCFTLACCKPEARLEVRRRMLDWMPGLIRMRSAGAMFNGLAVVIGLGCVVLCLWLAKHSACRLALVWFVVGRLQLLPHPGPHLASVEGSAGRGRSPSSRQMIWVAEGSGSGKGLGRLHGCYAASRRCPCEPHSDPFRLR